MNILLLLLAWLLAGFIAVTAIFWLDRNSHYQDNGGKGWTMPILIGVALLWPLSIVGAISDYYDKRLCRDYTLGERYVMWVQRKGKRK